MKGEWFADKKTLCDYMCIGSTFFDDYFRHDPRMRSCEYKKGTKKILWETEKAKKHMKDILLEIAE